MQIHFRQRPQIRIQIFTAFALVVVLTGFSLPLDNAYSQTFLNLEFGGTLISEPTADKITHVSGQFGRAQVSAIPSFNVTMALTPVSGNVLIACTAIMNQGNNIVISSISETGVTWTKQVGVFSNNGGWFPDAEIWAGSVGLGASENVTITLTGTPAWGSITNIYEYHGIATSWMLDRNATNQSISSSFPESGLTPETRQPNELIIGNIAFVQSSQTSSTNGFTLYDGTYNSSPYLSQAYLEKIVNSTGTFSTATTVSETNIFAACIATFQTFPNPQPTSLVISKSGEYYQANDSSSHIYFGGISNANGVNGLNFADVVGNSTIAVRNVTILEGNYIQDKQINCVDDSIISGQGNSTFIQTSASAKYNEYTQIPNFSVWGVKNVTIANMWLDGNPASTAFINEFGIFSWEASQLWVHDITFSNYNAGQNSGLDICYTTNSTFENIRTFNSIGTGIWIDIGSNDYVVRNCVSVSNSSMPTCIGIALVMFDKGNHTGLVTGNTIIGNYSAYGIEVYSSEGGYGITLSNNTIVGGNGNGYGSGIWALNFDNCTIEKNVIENCTGGSQTGILLCLCTNFVISDNAINYNNGYGIYVYEGGNNTITYNDLRYNGAGPISDDINITKDILANNLGIEGFPTP